MGQLSDLVRPIELMSDDELLQWVVELRHRRETVRPAQQKHIKTAVKKKTAGKAHATRDALLDMNQDDLKTILGEYDVLPGT